MKRLILFVAALVCCIGLYAQKNLVYEPVLLTIDKVDGRYAAGETVEVYGQLMGEVSGELVCTVESNGDTLVKRETVELRQGEKTLVYSGTFDKPSAVQVYVYPKDDDKQKAAVGFVVDAEGFRPGFDVPKDFEKFWRRQLKALRKCKMEAELKRVDIPKKYSRYEGKVELYALKVNMPEGRPVHAYVAWPADAKPASLPIMICPHGAGISVSRDYNALYWGSLGVIAVDLNAHGYPDDQPKEYYDKLAEGELKGYNTRKVVDHESFYFRLMYLRAIRAIDFAVTLPLWDGRRIISNGSSQGGAQAIAVAALDKRVGAVCAHVPAITDLAGHVQGHRGSWPATYAAQLKEGENLEANMKVLPYYDGSVMIRHTKAKLWIEAGLVDAVCPPECVISAFNIAPSTDKKLYTYPYRPHGAPQMDKRVHDTWVKTVDSSRHKEMLEWLK